MAAKFSQLFFRQHFFDGNEFFGFERQQLIVQTLNFSIQASHRGTVFFLQLFSRFLLFGRERYSHDLQFRRDGIARLGRGLIRAGTREFFVLSRLSTLLTNMLSLGLGQIIFKRGQQFRFQLNCLQIPLAELLPDMADRRAILVYHSFDFLLLLVGQLQLFEILRNRDCGVMRLDRLFGVRRLGFLDCGILG